VKLLLGSVAAIVVVGLALLSLGNDVPSVQAAPGTMSSAYRALYIAAAKTCPGLPPEVLMGIGQIESSHGADPGPSWAGAMGPMQVMPATWAAYAVDGNGDGVMDPYNAADAIYTAANLLCADGAGNPATLEAAVELYNPGDPTYAAGVLQVAAGYVQAVTGSPSPTPTSHP
jgi:soluble lytic murein transglycosylase-like protein